MLFLGYTAYLGINSAIETPVTIDNVNKITLQNAIFDDLYITNDMSQSSSPLTQTWDWKTIMWAKFDGDLMAGNTDFTIDSINKIRIKYREYGKVDWITFVDVGVNKSEDLSFERYCKYCRGGKTPYDFALIPVSPSGIEGNYNTNSVISDFNDLCIMSKDQTFHAINEEITPVRTQDSTIIKPLNGRYPVVIYQDEINYDALTVKGMFIELINGVYDKVGAWKYRNKAKDLLTSHTPLLIKIYDGRMWLVSVVENPSDDSNNYSAEGYTLTSFNCCEIGDANSYDDLVNNGLISTS